MRDADRLRLRVADQLFIALGDGLDGALAAAELGEADDLALRVALEQGLDLQHGPDGGFEIGQAAGPAEVAQVVDREDLRHAVPQRTQKGVGVVDAHPLAAAVDRAHDEQTLAERGAVGVNEQELARREFLAQLTRGDLAGGVGAADTGGHAHEQHVLPRLQHRGQHIEIALRRDLRGRDLRSAAHLRIKGLRVEGIEVQTGLLISVRVEGEGNDRDMLLLQIRSREIGRGIGYDSEHDVASFCM